MIAPIHPSSLPAPFRLPQVRWQPRTSVLGLEHFFILAFFPSTQLCSFSRHPSSAGADDHHVISSIGVQRRLRVAKSSDRCKNKLLGEMDELWMSNRISPNRRISTCSSEVHCAPSFQRLAQLKRQRRKNRTDRVSMNGNVMREKEGQNDGLR